MTKRLSLIGAMALSVLLVACGNIERPSNETIGTVGGAVAGGAVGSQIGSGTGRTVATIGGALLGGFIGNRIGRSLEASNEDRFASALEQNPIGETESWTDTDTGHQYAITPTNSFTSAQGLPCRDFITEVVADGQVQRVRGTACRGSDGNWRVVET